ncbi:hypothetical protein LTR84_008871 [Exophiala bonariae]|uniref:Major facilitator superfamily (MFS) profile domain-containing protein n=1 Tax=Exophiala bonariae TaxID=1690606 RepID=A0AAV9MXY1_9EURO|nr:hypothetical protein LTR84_008871 [Exophiala bonariae]
MDVGTTKITNPKHIEDSFIADLAVKDAVAVQEVEIDPALERKLRWKIDLYLMPALWILLVFSYIDRSNLGNARVAGMYTDLKLKDKDYYHAVVTFQVGYLIAGTPSNMVLVRARPSLYIPALMFLWGTCATCLGAVQNKHQLLAVRFLLGITEAGFAPGVFFLISSWYKREEQSVSTSMINAYRSLSSSFRSKRFIFFLSASILSGAFGGIIAGLIARHLNGAQGLPGWRWLFIVEGTLTAGISFIVPFFLLDFPATSKRLSPEEKKMAIARLAKEDITSRNANVATRLTHWRAFISAITNWRLYFLALPYMQLVGSSALAYFYPYLIQGLGYTAINAQFMTAPLYVVALAIAIPTSILADKFSTKRSLFVATIMLIGSVFCGLATGIRAYIPRYVFLCFINSAIWTGSPIALSYATSQLGPVDTETRAISLGIVNGLSQLAQVYGSALFPSRDAPDYLVGFGTYTGLFAVGSIIAFAGHFLLRKYPYRADFE